VKKVGITGVNGFVGTHLYNTLFMNKDFSIVAFQRDFFEDDSKMDDFVANCDVIVHLAGLNRSHDDEIIYKTNISLTLTLIASLNRTKTKPHIIFASSTQENLDNVYGKSKKAARLRLKDWSRLNDTIFTGLIIPNVFGPFGTPSYNSFISTFSYQLINNEIPVIINDPEVNLIYIDELISDIVNTIKSPISNEYFQITQTSTKRVSEVLELLETFKNEYLDKGQIPRVEINSFELNLFNTFRSYIPKTYFPRSFTKHIDVRGSFVEIVRANTAGQSSYSTTVPGITRGNHYHTRKVERFAIISGRASIQLRKVDSDEVIEYILDGEHPSYVDMPIWYTHNITNIGHTELITLFWINEPYNEKDSDTYFMEVNCLEKDIDLI
jgi:UDP-2-acetamido-2,6-beta-L-arabino-hexul-4-ose reductase